MEAHDPNNGNDESASSASPFFSFPGEQEHDAWETAPLPQPQPQLHRIPGPGVSVSRSRLDETLLETVEASITPIHVATPNPTFIRHGIPMPPGGPLGLVFKFLNVGDLMASRRVCRDWRDLISRSDEFINSTILNLTLEHQNEMMIFETQVPWRNARFRLFDLEDSIRSEALFHNSKIFFGRLVRVDFYHCFLNWTSMKKYLSMCPRIQDLRITRCTVLANDLLYLLTDAEEIAQLRATRGLRLISIYEENSISHVTDYLRKFCGCNVHGIESLTITYCPHDFVVSEGQQLAFFTVLLEFLQANSYHLRTLILDLRTNDLLQKFCDHVLTHMLTGRNRLNLDVFQLTPPSPQTGEFIIHTDSSRSLSIFHVFLDSQRFLKSVGFPHFANLMSREHDRLQLLDSLASTLEELMVPGQIYLRRHFLKIFRRLKSLFIGDKCGISRRGMLNPIRFGFDVRGGFAQQTSKNFLSLSTCAKMNYDSGKLYHIIEKFPKLTTFEINGMKSFLNDRDVQAIIRYLPKLRVLSITGCDLITDFGVTGIAAQTCMSLSRLSTIYTESDNIVQQKAICSRSLSVLKGLQKLHLIGQSKISDVGISLAFRFLELKSLHLPWNERITEWGLKEIGRNNPSLEVLEMTTAMATTSWLGFNHLIHTHPRIRHHYCCVNTIQMNQEDSISGPSLLTAILWDESDNIDSEPNT